MNESDAPAPDARACGASPENGRPTGARQTLLSELDDELALTRRLLERLPETALAWRPHGKSMSLGELASHLAEILRWGLPILERSGHDLEHDAQSHPTGVPSAAAALEAFDRAAADIRRALAGRTDAELASPWSLTQGRDLVMSLPRGAAVRRFLLNHLVHHRGQLTVYLRMHDVPLPPLYGASADERM